jgi:hypothetical protein
VSRDTLSSTARRVPSGTSANRRHLQSSRPQAGIRRNSQTAPETDAPVPRCARHGRVLVAPPAPRVRARAHPGLYCRLRRQELMRRLPAVAPRSRPAVPRRAAAFVRALSAGVLAFFVLGRQAGGFPLGLNSYSRAAVSAVTRGVRRSTLPVSRIACDGGFRWLPAPRVARPWVPGVGGVQSSEGSTPLCIATHCVETTEGCKPGQTECPLQYCSRALPVR